MTLDARSIAVQGIGGGALLIALQGLGIGQPAQPPLISDSLGGGSAEPRRRVRRRVVPLPLREPEPEDLEPITARHVKQEPQGVAVAPAIAKPVAARRASAYRRTRAQRDEELLLL